MVARCTSPRQHRAKRGTGWVVKLDQWRITDRVERPIGRRFHCETKILGERLAVPLSRTLAE
jgi:hypothetical protein